MALCGTAALSQAQFIAYDSIKGNYSWGAPVSGLKVYNPTPYQSWDDRSLAFQFTATGNGKLTKIEMAARYEGAGVGAGTLSVYSDNGGQVGTLLASRSFTPTASGTSGIGSVAAPVEFTSNNIQLLQNSKYWVEVSPAANMSADLLFNDVNTTQVSALRRGDSFLSAESWRPAVGMRVQAVPEPASLAAIAIGFGALIRRRRK